MVEKDKIYFSLLLWNNFCSQVAVNYQNFELFALQMQDWIQDFSREMFTVWWSFLVQLPAERLNDTLKSFPLDSILRIADLGSGYIFFK